MQLTSGISFRPATIKSLRFRNVSTIASTSSVGPFKASTAACCENVAVHELLFIDEGRHAWRPTRLDELHRERDIDRGPDQDKHQRQQECTFHDAILLGAAVSCNGVAMRTALERVGPAGDRGWRQVHDSVGRPGTERSQTIQCHSS